MGEVRRSEAVSKFLSERYARIRAGIVAFGVLLRIAIHYDLRAHDPLFMIPSLDSRAFLEWARDIAAGDALGSNVFFLNPLYPYFLAPFVGTFGSTPLLEIRLVQMALGVATILLVAAAVRKTLGDGTALGAAVLAAAWPLLVFYEQVVMIVTLAVFLNALALLLLARLPESPTLGRTLVAGLPLGLAVLARPNVGLFALLLPIWLLTVAPAGNRLRFAVTRTALLAAGALVVVLPCTIRNWVVGRDLVLVTSSSGVNLWVSNNPKARAERRMTSDELRANPNLIETDAIVYAERETGRDLRPSEVSAFWTRKTLARAAEEPGAALGFVGVKLLMFFRGFEIPSSYHFIAYREEAPLLGAIPLSWGMFSPFVLLGVVVALVRRRREALLFVLLFLAYAFGLAVYFPLAHYRAPVLPAAFPLGLLGLTAIGAPLLDRRWSAAGRLAPAAVLCLALAFPGPTSRALGHDLFEGYTDDRVVYWFNRGMVLLKQQKPGEAEEAFRRGRAADPTSWLPHMGFAAVAQSRGELANERRHLEDALDLRPDDPGALARLAVNLYMSGQREDGLALAAHTAERFPLDGVALTTLADLSSREGRLDLALDLYRRAENSGLDREIMIAEQSRILRMMERFDEAAATVDRGLRLLPESGPLRFEKAFLLLAAGAPPARIREEVMIGARSGYRVPPPLLEYVREDPR